jgi:hypothetical protein
MKNPIPAGFCAPTMQTAAIAIGIANLNAHALLIEHPPVRSWIVGNRPDDVKQCRYMIDAL